MSGQSVLFMAQSEDIRWSIHYRVKSIPRERGGAVLARFVAGRHGNQCREFLPAWFLARLQLSGDEHSCDFRISNMTFKSHKHNRYIRKVDLFWTSCSLKIACILTNELFKQNIICVFWKCMTVFNFKLNIGNPAMKLKNAVLFLKYENIEVDGGWTYSLKAYWVPDFGVWLKHSVGFRLKQSCT